MGLRKKEEIKEVVQEEPIVEEPKVEEVIVPTIDEEALVKSVNDKRTDYKKYADKQKKINYVITGIVAAMLIASFALMMIFSKIDWIIYVGLGVMVLVLIATYLSSKLMKKKLMENASKYIDSMYSEVADYIYKDEGVKDFEVTPKGKLEDKWFIDAHYYTNLAGTRSRNFVHYVLDGVIYDSCDLAGNTKVKGKLSPKFLGRFFSIKTGTKTDGKVTLFQLKGGNLSVAVDDIEDLKLIEGNDDYVVYSNDENVSKIFNKRLVSEIKSFKIQDPLIDVIVSLKDNLLSIGIDYVDEFMNIPVDKEFSIKIPRKAKQDYSKVRKIVDIVLDNYNHKLAEKENQK